MSDSAPYAQPASGNSSPKNLAHLENGQPVILAGYGKVIGSFVVDAVLIVAVVLGAYFYGARSATSEWTPYLMAIAAWLVASAVYGLFCPTGRTLGCLIAGSAFVRNSDGGRPGSFRMAWVTFLHYVLVVGLIVGMLFSGGAGTSTGNEGKRKYHRHIDLEATKALTGRFN
ncbi:hypothetical protein ACQR35_09940 [Pseudarthrobacter sp. J1738]|uniref:hypothetical protein n=1 Tax=unclassified Pseudarthrobacter TaxID=2647000 RepID=UPI003D27BE90